MFLLYSFFISALCIVLLINGPLIRLRILHDTDLESVQKYHDKPTPRIGGVAIYMSFLATALILHFTNNFNDSFILKVVISGSIAFFIGLLEDVTKKISPRERLLAFVLTTFFAIYIIHSMPIIYSTYFIGLNNLIQSYPIIGLAFSLFAVVGLINAYNIIDGYNGLAATTALINSLALAIIAFWLSDIMIYHTILCLLGGVLGLLLFNYPRGKIFLGDGGAYLIGFISANFCISIAHAHIGYVSPYVFLLINIYPITEIGFSMYRKKFLRGTHTSKPDGLHFHMIVYKRCIPIRLSNVSRNSRVMPLMLFMILPEVIWALIFYKNSLMCLLGIFLFVIYYIISYFKMVRFKTFTFFKIYL